MNEQTIPLPTAEERAAMYRDIDRQRVRQAIDGVADAKSREGVMSDVLGVVVVGLAQLTIALSKAKTLAEVNAAAQPLADIGTAVDAAVKSGALKLPYMVKAGGAQAVLTDMTKLSNGVAAVFAAAQTPAK
jgi:hypothetical protein